MELVVLVLVTFSLGFLINIQPFKKTFQVSIGVGIFVALITLGLLSVSRFDVAPVPNLNSSDFMKAAIAFVAVVTSFTLGTWVRNIIKGRSS